MSDYYETKLLEKYTDFKVSDYLITLKGDGKFSIKDAFNIFDMVKNREQLIIFVSENGQIACMRIDGSGNIESPIIVRDAHFEVVDKKNIRISNAGDFSDIYSPIRSKRHGKFANKENLIGFLIGGCDDSSR